MVDMLSFLRQKLGKNASGAPVWPRFHSHDYCLTFSALVREHWEEIHGLTKGVDYKRGAVIYTIGDESAAIYSIASGRVKMVRVSTGGREQTVAIYAKSDIFGEICLCAGRIPREEQAVAIEDTNTLSFDTRELWDLMKQQPQLTFELCLILCSRLHESQEQVSSLVFDDTRQRLAKQLLLLNQSFNFDTDGGAAKPIALTHEELANLVSTTRERITLLLNEFRRLGLVQYSTANIRVDEARTKRYLEQHSAPS